jgi:hypothetical protein
MPPMARIGASNVEISAKKMTVRNLDIINNEIISFFRDYEGSAELE